MNGRQYNAAPSGAQEGIAMFSNEVYEQLKARFAPPDAPRAERPPVVDTPVRTERETDGDQ